MLSRENRLARSDGFAPVLKEGGKAANRVLAVSASLRANGRAPQAGVIVGKREFALASSRNQIKRRLRHVLASRLQDLPGGTAVVVRALPGARGLSSAELGENLDRLLTAAMRKAANRMSQGVAS